MAVIKPEYTAVTVTGTIGSQATNTWHSLAAVDNSTNLYDDFVYKIDINSGASGFLASGYINFWLATSQANSNYTDGVTSDATFTPPAQHNLIYLGQTRIVALNNTLFKSNEMSLLAALQAAGAASIVSPPYHIVVIENQAGGAFNASGHVISCSGRRLQIV